MKQIRDMQSIIGLLEDGEFNPELSREARDVLAKLTEMSQEQRGKSITGSVSVKLKFTVKDDLVEIASTFDSTVPKRPRKTSHFWIVEDGALSTEHPRQHDIFAGPRDVAFGCRGLSFPGLGGVRRARPRRQRERRPHRQQQRQCHAHQLSGSVRRGKGGDGGGEDQRSGIPRPGRFSAQQTRSGRRRRRWISDRRAPVRSRTPYRRRARGRGGHVGRQAHHSLTPPNL